MKSLEKLQTVSDIVVAMNPKLSTTLIQNDDYRRNVCRIGLVTVLVFTAVFLMLLLLSGGMYVYNLEAACLKHGNTIPSYQEHFRVDNGKEKQDIHIDRDHRIERITSTDSNGDLLFAAIFNYDLRLITLHIPEDKKCYLIGGIFEKLGSFEDSIKTYIGETEHEHDQFNITYKQSDTLPVVDTSLITQDLLTFCNKTNIFWLERDFNDDADNINNYDMSADNTDSKEQDTDDTVSKEQATDNTDSKEQATDNTDSKEQVTDNTDSKEQVKDNENQQPGLCGYFSINTPWGSFQVNRCLNF